MRSHLESMGYKRKRFAYHQRGQGTVEYAVVFIAFLALVIALGIYSDFLREGTIIQHLFSGASHHLLGSRGVLRDVFLY